MTIGKLIEVDVRELWQHEQYDFSEWLAKEENIEYLNDIVGLTLVSISPEVYIGPFRCDLSAIDEATGTKVIIENQLSPTNHDHLGKIITYASGLDAEVIIWITTNARKEHRSAVEWLNSNMKKDISFFLIELQAFKIGNSLPAPNFKVLEEPNDFIKQAPTLTDKDDLNNSQSERLLFWTEFNEMLYDRGKPFNIRKATTDHWYDVAIGSSKAHISISLVNKEGKINLEIYVRDDKNLYDYLELQKDDIHRQLGFEMEWNRLNNRKASRIIYSIDGLDFDDHSNYPELMNRIINKVLILRNTFKDYI